MCGICGTIALGSSTPDPTRVEPMLAALRHRGPDSQGSFSADRVCFGARRLKVIDLETGDQPIANEDGSVHVVFNGEIYNYRDLTRRLAAGGHRFRTRSDTEVLVHLWEDHGPAMLDDLHGMFALCIHDARRDEVLVARDRMGIKPLYYAQDGERLVFASELAALVRHGGIDAPIDEDRLLDLFLLQYIPGDATLYRGVKKLLPGHLLRVRGGVPAVERWYDPSERAADPPAPRDWDGAVAQLPGLLADAVRERTIADVPIGMFLSGGIDSSIILGLLAAGTAEPPRTYSVGFEGEPSNGELGYARLVARRHGTRHQELTFSARDVERGLPALIEHAAEPILDPATLPTRALSELARREVTVVLTGEGADELFGGYRRYLYQTRYAGLGRVPGLRSAVRLPGVERLLPSRTGQALAALAETDPARNHLRWAATVDPATASGLFDPDAILRFEERACAHFEPYFENGAVTLQAALRSDLHEWLPHNLLLKVDRASMACSLEARVPFLDHRVVEWVAGLPEDFKIRGRETKRILREAFRAEIPPEILRRPKRGFDLPLDDWFRGPLRDLAGDILRRPGVERWSDLNGRAAVELLDRHVAGRQDHGMALFGLVSTLIFLESAP
jgi:asparagine synthase (glutamine-hydrolysing)